MKRIFQYDGVKPSTAQFAVQVDLSSWLGTGITIQTVSFSAKCLDDGTDASTVVLDALKNDYTTVIVRPWLKGGTSGKTYLVKMNVIGTNSYQDTFGLQFTVYDY